ncbi:MAG: PepSY domain-containing protein [Hyphomicrobium sp.]
MKRMALIAFSTFALTGAALADAKPSADEAKKITDAIAAAGYSGGEMEKESEGSGVYEVDDAKSKDGMQYDIKLDKDFKILSVTRD